MTSEPREHAGGGVQHRAVAAADAGLRLDRWFQRHFPDLPHALLQRWVRQGQVRVDGHRVRAGDRLAAGQTVRVPPLPAGRAEAAGGQRRVPAPATAREAESLRRRVLYVDPEVLVIDKPAGLAVQGGTGTARHLDGMLDALRFGGERPRLVHRLDRDTSGVLALARSAAAAAALARAFRQKSVRKLYWAIVEGRPQPALGRIERPLAKRDLGDGERMQGSDDGGGRRAVTLYATRATLGDRLAWLELEPETGRTHQLRVHCAMIGTPILGDRKYGRGSADLAGLGLGRGLHLHARAIVLPRAEGSPLTVAAPLPPHMLQTWRSIGFALEDEATTLRRWLGGGR